jgi:hypothetical protein
MIFYYEWQMFFNRVKYLIMNIVLIKGFLNNQNIYFSARDGHTAFSDSLKCW